MATKNVTNLKTAALQSEDQLRAKLTDADAFTQAATATIAAAARGAKALLALDAQALESVRHLLDLIATQAGGLANDVNYLAEQAGANWVDEREREASSRLWAQHHALRGTPGAGSVQ